MRSVSKSATVLVAVWLWSCGGRDGAAHTVAEVSDCVETKVAAGDLLEAWPESSGNLAELASEELAQESDSVETETVEENCPLPGTRWRPGMKIFKEVTSEWGLDGIEGYRLSVTDIDGDLWPDLLVRCGEGPDDFGPEGVRHRWVLRNTGARSFEDVTEASGLLAARYGEGTRPGEVMASGDVDNDGDLDIFIGTAVHYPDQQQETSEILLNNGDGTFELGPEDCGLRREGLKSVPAGAAFTDYDRDGFLDLWMSQNMAAEAISPLQDVLFKGDGAAGFVDVTNEAGLQTVGWLFSFQLNEALGHSWGWSAAACDLNNDGVPELLASSYGRAPNHLWRGQWVDAKGTVKYVNASVSSGYAYDHRMDWTDNESARCFCKLHPDAEDCQGVPPPKYIKCETDADILRWNHEVDREPWRLGGNSGATMCEDVDNDGWVDLMTSEIVHWDVGSSSDPSELMFNTRVQEVVFERPGNEVTGLVRKHSVIDWNDGDMSGAVFDFDNDGWLDIYIGSSDYPGTMGLLFHQESPRKYVPVPVEDYFEHHRAHGVVAADFDRDGDLDMIVGNSRMRCEGAQAADCYPTPQIRMFENILCDGLSNWVELKLVGGEGSNRAAIGARATLTTPTTSQIRDVDGGHGHFGTQKDLVLHFGLGKACSGTVQIRWPDRALTIQEFPAESGKLYLVKQGEEPLIVE